MSKGSAIISILVAFVAGLVIGHLANRGSGVSGEPGPEIAVEGDRGGDVPAGTIAGGPTAAPAGGVERLRADVTPQMPSRGPADALVTIVMFSDYQCPFCSRVEPTISRLLNEHRNDVRVVWRDQPLPFHQNAKPAAEAAREAFAQGGNQKFWQMHDLLFENQQSLDRPSLERFAQQIGLDMTRFRAALDNHTHQATIDADSTAGNAIGARGTPAFFINGRNLMGAQPYEEFNRIVTEEIATAQQMVRSGTPLAQVYAALMRGARTSPAPEPAAPAADRPAPRQPDPNAVYRVTVGNSPAKGPADALVTIVEFSEFQCPFCSRVLPTMNQIRERYGDDVRVVFKHNPLPFHPNAMPASEAAMEALAQGGPTKFWQMHDLLFENQQALERPNLERFAQQIGLDMNRFRAALDNHTHQERIRQDQQMAQQMGASGTPSFFINGRNLRGAQPFEAFQRVIDEELQRARRLVEAGTPRAQVYEALIRDGHTSPQFIGAPEAPAAAPEPPPDRVYQIPVPRNAPSRGGPANAPVTVQLFSDFQCPFCGRVRPTLDQIEERFGRQVRIVWRNYPLPFHQNAMPAAEAATEVFAQGGNEKFWAFHDLLFENQQSLDRASLERFAQQVGGIDMNRFRQTLDNHTHEAAVRAEMTAVQEAGAQIGTPSLFINGRLIQGAQPFPAFEAAINSALQER
ncbi:MAG: thioredoxin domain-containing protein [Sandaracinaceae bacterium]|nr:thioredoxin domain-containing protein [Sandaracinaceae bacterium]